MSQPGPATRAAHAPGSPERDSPRYHRAGELVERKRDVVDAHAHASVWEVLARMHINRVLAMPVWGEHAHWIAAGGVAATVDHAHPHGRTAARQAEDKVYIGVVSMADILRWLLNFPAPWASVAELQAFLEHTKVTELIGQTPESRSLWIAPAQASLVCIMEPLSKGLHRWLVESHDNFAAATTTPIPLGTVHAVPTTASLVSPSSSSDPHAVSTFRIATQTDVVRFLHANRPSFPAINAAAQRPLSQLNLIRGADHVVRVTPRTPALDALRVLTTALVNAAAVVADDDAGGEGNLVGEWTWADVRDPAVLAHVLTDARVVVGQVMTGFCAGASHAGSTTNLTTAVAEERELPPGARHVVTVTADETLEGVLDRIVYARAHRAWVTEAHGGQGRVVGVVTLTDVVNVCLKATMHEN